jgi:adenine-specific DNA-methyltransferase
MPWYRLHWPRRREEMVGPKLVVPRRAQEPRFCLDLSGSAISSDCTYLVAPPEVEEPVEYLIRLMLALNSPWVSKWLESNGKRKGKMFEFYSTPLRSLPVEPLKDFSERARLGLSQVLESKEAFVDLR